MNRLSIGQQNNSKVATFHLFNLRPAADTTVSLDLVPQRIGDRPLKPFIKNGGSVRTFPDFEEVPGESLYQERRLLSYRRRTFRLTGPKQRREALL